MIKGYLLLLLISFGVARMAIPQQSHVLSLETKNDSIVSNTHGAAPGTTFIIDSIVLTGNKVTKDFIILRELTFKPQDTLSATALHNKYQESRNNLLKTSLFNFVIISDSVVMQGEMTHLSVTISFVERWYIWPFPVFEISDRNLNVWLEEKNYDRVSYGLYLLKQNNRGRGELLRLFLRFGYDERYEISYLIPYINEKQTVGAGIGAGWIQNHEVPYRTVNNKQEFVKDDQKYLFTQYYSYFNLSFRPNFYQFHTLQARFNFFSFEDTLLALNPDYSFYGQKTNEYVTLTYKFISDYRDSKVNPLTGHYFEGMISKSGFGLMKDGDIEMMELLGSYRKYWELPKRFYASTDWTGKISTNRDQPYFYQRGLGFDRNYVRGYELYVVDGQSFILGKNALRYAIIPEKSSTISFLKSEKFNKIHYALFANLFVDVGFVDAYRYYDATDLSNNLLYGLGAGIDLVTYYDMIFRVEVSVNKQGETGFYIHFKDTL